MSSSVVEGSRADGASPSTPMVPVAAENSTDIEENRPQPGRSSSLAGKMKYYAQLAVSRKPLEFQQQQGAPPGEEGLLDEPEGKYANGGESNWRGAVGRIVEGLSFRRNVIGIRSDTGADRFASAVALEVQLKDHPHRDALIKALNKKQNNDYTGLGDRLANELFILGEHIFDWFTPSKFGDHPIVFTILFFLVLVVTFFYMAAEFPRFLEEHDIAAPIEYDMGPSSLWRWIVRRGETYHFNFDFLVEWGGRYGGKMTEGREGWRWITSIFIHQSFSHLFNNIIIFFLFSTHLEHKYGFWRIGFLCILSGIGGNFLSAAFEDICAVVVGASGSCFGLMGLFVADMVLNFETVSFPILRAFFILLMLALFVYTVLTEGDTSHISHAGGFLAGLFPGFVLLPNITWEKWEASLPFLGIFTMIVFFLVLPIVVYTIRLPGLVC